MKSNVPNTTATDLFQQLIVQLEHAWNRNREDQLVDRLAAEHPELAEQLYEFFADLVEADLELDRPRPDLAAADERARQWLEREGYRKASAARSAAAVEKTPTPTAATTGPSSSPEPVTPPRAPRPTPAGGAVIRAPRPFLGLLREETGESTSVLAAALDVTADFLVDISDNADVLTEAARAELADRAARARGIDHGRSLAALATCDSKFKRAASRDSPYRPHKVTYAELVRRSGLAPEQQQYWLRFA